MTSWYIPGKTFLIGEYAALSHEPAILLTTKPCFEISLVSSPGLHGISPLSPAGRFWNSYHDKNAGLLFRDPYEGRGGMGASSAQFLGAYYAHLTLSQKKPDRDELLSLFLEYSKSDKSILPSGYDVLAQSTAECVYIERNTNQIETFSWPFSNLAFLLIHTGEKLATHEHLKSMIPTSWMKSLGKETRDAKRAFETCDEERLVHVINKWYQLFREKGWVLPHTISLIEKFQSALKPLAMKGCGAMGADVVLMLLRPEDVHETTNWLKRNRFFVIADTDCLFKQKMLQESL